MLKIAKYPGHGDVLIVVSTHDEERLARTCFRPKDRPLAGNFLHWKSAQDLFEDRHVVTSFLDRVMSDLPTIESWGLVSERTYDWDGCSRPIYHRYSFSLPMPSLIGWSSTGWFSHYEKDALEPFRPNRRTRGALAIKADRTDIFAPWACQVTFSVEAERRFGHLSILVKTIYPGPDIGGLYGKNFTERTGHVFFPWDHPGHPM